jgi:iron complex transport system substrate-binding protein
MRRAPRLVALTTAALLAGALAACGSDSAASDDTESSGGSGDSGAITIEHAFGTTTIEGKPERVATVNWANHEVPLALGVVPVGMAAANFGDDDGDGLLPWVSERLEELDAETPVLFDETDGIDFEAVADTEPDVILAAYSGLTQEDYDTLSEIAPVVAFPEAPWATAWRDVIEVNAAGMGMAEEGQELVADIEGQIADSVGAHPALEGKSAMFLTHVDTTDLSEVSFYTPYDTRSAFFEDLGLTTPASIEAASTDPEQFSGTVSAEQIDVFDDVDIIVTYGDQALVDALNADPLLSKIPAVANGSIVLLGNDALGTAANPTPLAISFVLDDYVTRLSEAADKAA